MDRRCGFGKLGYIEMIMKLGSNDSGGFQLAFLELLISCSIESFSRCSLEESTSNQGSASIDHGDNREALSIGHHYIAR